MVELPTIAECINIGINLDPLGRRYPSWCSPPPAESIHAGTDNQEDALHAEDHDALEGLTDSSEAGNSDSGIAETDKQEDDAAEESSHQATEGQEQPEGGGAAAAAGGGPVHMPSAKPRRRCDPGLQPVWQLSSSLAPACWDTGADCWLEITCASWSQVICAKVVTLPGSQVMRKLHVLPSL